MAPQPHQTGRRCGRPPPAPSTTTARARRSVPSFAVLLVTAAAALGIAEAFVLPTRGPSASRWAKPRSQSQQQQILAPASPLVRCCAAPTNETDSGLIVRKKKKDADAGPGDAAAEKAALEQNRRQAEAAMKLMASGANPAQLSAYTGIKLVQLQEGFQPNLQVTPSHMFVDRDKEGDLKQARFVYVDEYTCIGCTNCANVAPNTFFMEDEHGRARVFQQWKDRPSIIQTAIETCPVDCIHYVPFEELERLEQERDRMVINYKARLVGSDGLLSSGGAERGMQDISGNKEFRCPNCPSRGCANCPLFGVGENPEYLKKQAKIKAKREARKKREEGGNASGTGKNRREL